MKKSEDWATKTDLFKRLDQLAQDKGFPPEELKIYSAARALGIEPNGRFYAVAREWAECRVAERDQPEVDVSPEAQAGFRKALETFSDDAMGHFQRALRMAVNDVNGAALLRIAAAERRASKEQAAADEVIASWVKTEEELRAVRQKVETLERELAEGKSREERLAGRLEERGAIMQEQVQAAKARTAIAKAPEPSPDIASEQDGRPAQSLAATDAAQTPARASEVASDRPQAGPAGKPPGSQPPLPDGRKAEATASDDKASAAHNSLRDDRPSASEPDRPKGGQSELPLASSDAARKGEDR